MHIDRERTLARADRMLAYSRNDAAVYARVPLELSIWEAPGEPVPFAEARTASYRPATPGQAWGAAWSTAWLHVTATVPTEWRIDDRHRLELSIDLGFNDAKPGFQCEGLVRTPDGVAVKGLEPRNHQVQLAARPGELVEFFVEAAANPDLSGGNDFADPLAFAPTPYGDVRTAPREPLYRLGVAELRLVDVERESLEREVRVLRGLAAELAETDPRRSTILVTVDRALDAYDAQDPAETAPLARRVLAPVLASPAAASAHRIVATGHAHIDSAWLWPTRETVRKCIRTFANVLELMDADPELNFTCSSAQQYAWVKQHDPELFARLTERVREGRFVPVGNMWVESDVVMPSGESLVRQLRHGSRFFEAEFGRASDVGWLPDSFGYTGALPQLLRQAGLRWFFTQKMSWNDTNAMPHHSFLWEGNDGTRLFTHFPPVNTYSGDMRPTELARDSRNFTEHGHASVSLMPYGYGDGGGGPTRDMMALGRLQGDLEGSPRLSFGTAREFFLAAEAEYAEPPVWAGEMYLEFHRGIFTSQARTKRGNRRNERLLAEAETWASTATVLTGAPYPAAELEELWESVLLLQFHDILPGTAIAWVHREAEAAHTETTGRLEALIARSLRILTGEGTQQLAVNAAPLPLAGVPARGGIAVTERETLPTTLRRQGDEIVLENALLSVTVAADGTISSLIDRSTGRQAIPEGASANLLQLHRDEPHQWDAWDIDPCYRAMQTELRDGTVEIDGTVVRVMRRFGHSSLSQRIELDPFSPAVRIRTEVDWHERQRLLKLAFPLDVHTQTASYETQFGHVTRPVHTNTSWDAARYEVCAHRWVHLGEPGFGVAIGNDGVYGHDVTRSVIGGEPAVVVRQSLLRAPTFPDPDADQGVHVITSTLTIAPGISDAVRAGRGTDAPPRLVQGAHPPRPLITVASADAATPTSIVAETLTLAADGSGDVIVRLYESEGRRGVAALSLAFRAASVRAVTILEREPDAGERRPGLHQQEGTILVSLRPFEVATLRIAVDGPLPAFEGDEE